MNFNHKINTTSNKFHNFTELRHENNEDYKENNQDTKNLYHQPSIGSDTLKIFH